MKTFLVTSLVTVALMGIGATTMAGDMRSADSREHDHRERSAQQNREREPRSDNNQWQNRSPRQDRPQREVREDVNRQQQHRQESPRQTQNYISTRPERYDYKSDHRSNGSEHRRQPDLKPHVTGPLHENSYRSFQMDQRIERPNQLRAMPVVRHDHYRPHHPHHPHHPRPVYFYQHHHHPSYHRYYYRGNNYDAAFLLGGVIVGALLADVGTVDGYSYSDGYRERAYVSVNTNACYESFYRNGERILIEVDRYNCRSY